MPEGDTIHAAADRLGDALRGATVLRAAGSHRAMLEYGQRIVGSAIAEATAHGKHVLLHFSNGWTLRTHMRMTGVWHLYVPGERWLKSPGKARVVLETTDVVAVCFSAPTVQLAPRHIVAANVGQLGPDLMSDIDATALARRVHSLAADVPINEAITDQSIVSGVGNVYKSEVLFMANVHPDTPTAAIDIATMEAVIARAHQLLNANRGKRRTATGSRSPGGGMWVYGRRGEACRRCSAPIGMARRGPLARTTYWCPSCQPPPPAA